jgi:hypothetical protein
MPWAPEESATTREGAPRDERRGQQDREQEVPQVVARQVVLEAVGGGGVGAAHHARIVDQDVDAVVVGEDALGAGANARQ